MSQTTSSSRFNETLSTDILVVGGGFGGCYALYSLRKVGYNVKLIEAGSDFGGVWHFNSYPGARVDSEVPLYQLSVPEAYQSFQFTERFPGHIELRQYFAQMSDSLDLRRDAIFNARVIGARYDITSARWIAHTDTGIEANAQYIIFATGTTNKPYIPKFPGLDVYEGDVIHPCRWPAKLDIKGKKIGIVGQGESGLQILQELAKEDADNAVFVRNPPTALPMAQRSITGAEAEEQKNQYEALFSHAKTKDESGYAYNGPRDGYNEIPFEERQRFYENLWARGSYSILTSNFPEHAQSKEANAELYQFWAKKVRARISDPIKRNIMAPLDQFQWIGTKRPNLEMDYYEMIDRPNVKLVNLKERTIQRFTASGIVTDGPDGETQHHVDIVIMATGYDSVTGSLYEMNIKDKDGCMIQNRWAGSILTYLGMMAPGLPNAFILYGPQAPSGLANGPPFLEMQVDWIVQFLGKLKKESKKTFEVNTDVAKAYVERNLIAYSQSLAKDTPSWWNGSNIPGKNNEPLFWVLGLQAWREETNDALEDLARFTLQ